MKTFGLLVICWWVRLVLISLYCRGLLSSLRCRRWPAEEVLWAGCCSPSSPYLSLLREEEFSTWFLTGRHFRDGSGLCRVLCFSDTPLPLGSSAQLSKKSSLELLSPRSEDAGAGTVTAGGNTTRIKGPWCHLLNPRQKHLLSLPMNCLGTKMQSPSESLLFGTWDAFAADPARCPLPPVSFALHLTEPLISSSGCSFPSHFPILRDWG